MLPTYPKRTNISVSENTRLRVPVREEMTQIHRIPVLIPLAVGIITFACTIFVHVLPLGATVTIVRHEKRLGWTGTTFWSNFAIVALVILLALVAHLIEIALWAVLFVICGEFHDFGTAYYHRLSTTRP